jgi:hypothetical protein
MIFLRILLIVPEVLPADFIWFSCGFIWGFSCGYYLRIYLRIQLPTKILAGNQNPQEIPQETHFLRIFDLNPQEKNKFLVVEEQYCN